MRTAISRIGILVAALALSSAVVIAEEKVYRWVDADGVVHFGDQPHGQFDSTEVTMAKAPKQSPVQTQATPSGTPPASEEAGAEGTEGEPSYAQQRRDARAKQRKEAEKKKQEVAASCELHQKLVAQLEPMTRVIVQRDDGTVERMDDNERLDQLKKSKDFVAENCRD